MEPLDIELDEGELELPTDPMLLNMGPSHPAGCDGPMFSSMGSVSYTHLRAHET